VPPTLDTALLTGWTRAATTALERHCAEIDRINVFPVPDGDTGTNLLLTMRAAAEAARRAVRENGGGRGVGAAAAALARGALVGARGNSGVILSQVLRGLAEAVAPAPRPAGAVLADALRRIGEGECVIDPTIVSRLVARKRARGPLDVLTEREREVLALVAEGRSNGAIGEKLFLSRKTVDSHISQIFLKLDLRESPEHHRRVLAVLAFLRSG
jgi:DNA-binding CsgD family transcriptional regulator